MCRLTLQYGPEGFVNVFQRVTPGQWLQSRAFQPFPDTSVAREALVQLLVIATLVNIRRFSSRRQTHLTPGKRQRLAPDATGALLVSRALGMS